MARAGHDKFERSRSMTPSQNAPTPRAPKVGLIIVAVLALIVATMSTGTSAGQAGAPAARSERGGVEAGAPAARSERGGVEAGVPAARSERGGVEAGAATGSPTFTRDIAPILQRSCQNCHRPTSIAPMSL